MAKTRRRIIRARSAITGRFVRKSTAKSHPRTTIVQRMKRRKK